MKPPLHPLVAHLIYGDLDEMSLDVLGDSCPTPQRYAKLDPEQQTRLQAAATVQAWMNDELHKGGYRFDLKRHKPQDKI